MKQDKQPNAVARLSKSSHDMSFDRSWTSSTGHIIPVVHDFLNAGETVQCSIDLKTRMQPILRPAMLDIHQKIKYFFVPIDMLYSLFGAIRYQVDDFFSSVLAHSNIPVGDSFVLYDFASTFDLTKFVNVSAGSDVYSVHHSGATDFNTSTSAGLSPFDQYHQGAHRLLDALGFDPNVVFKGSNSNQYSSAINFYSPNVFPYQLLAYQAIYFHYFRDEDFEKNFNPAFNVDQYYSNTTAVVGSNVLDVTTLRYVGRYKDFFTNIHYAPVISERSLLNGDASANDILSQANYWLADNGLENASLSDTSNSLNTQTGNAASMGLTFGYVPYQNVDDSPDQQINASQLRLLFAVDKLMTVTGRARKRVDDQVLAHFGFKIPTDVKHNIQYLGEQDGSFAVGDVVSTSDTAGVNGAVLGELAGKAFGRVDGNGVRKFTAPCDGVFMGVYYSMPKVRYEAGYDRKNAVTSRTDLFIPEFDHLGQQPMFHYQLDTTTNTTPAQIFGWQWRYEQWKRNFDTVSWAFRKDNNSNFVNVLSAWTPIMQPNKYALTTYAEYFSLKVTPHDLDNIMVLPFSSDPATGFPHAHVNPAEFYYTDPFIHDMHVNYKKLSTMSTFSVPNLDNQI